MKQRIIFSFLIIFLLCTISTGVSASSFDWKVYETDHFVLFYPIGYKYQAEEVLYYLEKYRQDTMDLVGNEDDFKTLVVLQDAGLESYGEATSLNNKINLFTNNPSTLSRLEGLEGYNSWFKQVTIHEFTHLAQTNNASGIMGKLTDLAGDLYSPNVYTPTWMKEGMAVYNESKVSQYEGRLNNGYYESFIGSKVKNGDLPDLIELPYGNNEYIYGAKFFDYLAQTYGEAKFTKYFKDYSDNYFASLGVYLPALGIDSSAEKIYGKSFPQLFEEWKEYEKNQYQNWKIDATEIVNNKEGKISKLTTYEDKIYYIRDEVYNPAPFTKTSKSAIVEYNPKTRRERVLDRLELANNASLQVIDNKIYYSTRNSGVGVLYSYNLATGRTRGLSFGMFKDFVVLENGDIIYVNDAKDGYGSEIWRYSKNSDSDDNNIKKIGSVDQLISEIVAYKDNFIIVSKERLGSWNINYLKEIKDDSTKDNFTLEPVVNTPYLEKFIKVNGSKVYFTANYNNKYAVYQYNLDIKELVKVTTSSYATDGVVNNDQLYFVGVNNDGEGVYRKELNPKKYPLPKKEQVEEVDLNIVSRVEEKNPLLKNLSYLLKPYVRFPYLEAEDALGETSYHLDYLNDFNTVITRKSFDPYKSISINNFKDKLDDQRKNNFHFSFSSYPWSADFIGSKDFLYVDGGYRKEKYFKNSSLALQTNMVFGSSDEGFRGFSSDYNNILEIMSVNTSLEYTHKLFEIRKGIWNPNLFIGDIYGNVLAEYYVSELRRNYEDPYYPYDPSQFGTIYVLGYELLFEMMTGFNLKVVPSLGVKYYEKQGIEPYLEFNTYF